MILALLMGLAGWQANAAESYIIIDNQTGVILDSDKRNEKLQVASLTKVATSLVVLDWAELEKVDGQLAHVGPQGAAIMNGGERMKVRNKIVGLAFFLQLDRGLHHSKIVAEMQCAGWLDAG